MIEENDKDQEFISKVDKLLAESANVDYPPHLHQRAMFVWNESVSSEKPKHSLRWLGYTASLGFAVFVALFVSGDTTSNMAPVPLSANNKVSRIASASTYVLPNHIESTAVSEERAGSNATLIATNMGQDELEEVSDSEVGEFYEKLKKFNESNKGRKIPSVIYLPSAPAANLASDR